MRRFVFVISDERFHRLAERAVIAPLLETAPAIVRPWHVPLGDRVIAVNLLGTTPVARLLERIERAGFDTLRRVRRAVLEISN